MISITFLLGEYHHWTNIGMFDCRERSFKWRTISKYFAVFSPLTTVE